MKLNQLERLFILSPLRNYLQKHVESKKLFELGGAAKNATVLEVGCGAGYAVDLIYRRFGVRHVDAFDVDLRMVELAKNRRYSGRKPHFWLGNLRHIPTPDERYDAVFNFGAIHHVIDWRASLKEIHRVLKPGGTFYCEEILKKYIVHPVIGKLMDHPQTDRFDDQQFINALKQHDFIIKKSSQFADLYVWVVATKAN